ncbi:MAG: DUF3558 domain-containing protein [Rhodococcus sp.]|nr:DUF3558 domain-containing protein [Rhodococcus sp. (in: high G+C Gram-positive bacteria)]
MGRKWGAFVAVGLVAVLFGCSGGEEPQADPGSALVRPEPTEPGPFIEECGSLTDQEVAEAFGMPPFTTVTRNSVGCVWEVGGVAGPSVTYSWYRGSPIGRERAGSELIGRPAADIEIGGHTGFIASASDYLCEIGIAFGGDFVHWSIMYGDSRPAHDPCQVGRALAEKTVERVQ